MKLEFALRYRSVYCVFPVRDAISSEGLAPALNPTVVRSGAANGAGKLIRYRFHKRRLFSYIHNVF